LETSLGKQFAKPYLEKPFTKIGLVEGLRAFKLQYHQKKKKR
jgi:hypothetical protein